MARSAIGRVWSFVRLGRPLFLAGGFLLNGLGVAAALTTGAQLNLAALVWGQVAITATQLMTHYSNDYFDLPADRANLTFTPWSGGSRVLPGGDLPPWVALATAIGLGIVALGAGLVLAVAVQPAPLTLPLLLLALLLSWVYSAPPLTLHSRGVGEVVAATVVPGLTPLVAFYLQTGRIEPLPLLASVPLWYLQFAMFMCIEFPDAAGDAAVGKRTLVVRLGPAAAARLHNLALLAAYTLLPWCVRAGLPLPVAAAACLGAPITAWQGWRIARGAWAEPARWGSLAFWGVGLLVGTTAAEFLAFLWLCGIRP